MTTTTTTPPEATKKRSFVQVRDKMIADKQKRCADLQILEVLHQKMIKELEEESVNDLTPRRTNVLKSSHGEVTTPERDNVQKLVQNHQARCGLMESMINGLEDIISRKKSRHDEIMAMEKVTLQQAKEEELFDFVQQLAFTFARRRQTD